MVGVFASTVFFSSSAIVLSALVGIGGVYWEYFSVMLVIAENIFSCIFSTNQNGILAFMMVYTTEPIYSTKFIIIMNNTHDRNMSRVMVSSLSMVFIGYISGYEVAELLRLLGYQATRLLDYQTTNHQHPVPSLSSSLIQSEYLAQFSA